MGTYDLLEEWYRNWYMDPRVNPEYVESGDRYSESDTMTSHCQYWVKGMPGLCKHWSGECTHSWSDSVDKPLYFNEGKCDGLGRAADCTKYDPIVVVEEGYICILPKLDMSGEGKQDLDSAWYKTSSVPIDEVEGYNPADEKGVGQCDALGMGRGVGGYGLSKKELYQLPVVCQYYRPWQMGFGAIVPRGVPELAQIKQGGRWVANPLATTAEIYDGKEHDPRSPMGRQLPYSFKVYNARAVFQKCAHWEADTPLFFDLDTSGGPGLESIVLPGDASELCGCREKDSSSIPYSTLKEDWDDDVTWIIQDVWSEANTVICNGAKPECPCYTGRWVYCNDEKMRAGMRITVDQVMELRFWTSRWETKEEYIKFFEKKPGPTDGFGVSDPTTHLLYTFTHWERLDPNDPNASEMHGYRYDMCVPAPLHMRYYDPEIYITQTAYQYPPLKKLTPGMTTTDSPRFPTLVRDIETKYVHPLDVYYPYSSKNPFGDVECEPSDEDVGIKRNCKTDPDEILVVGHTLIEKIVYAININKVRGYFLTVNSYITKYNSVEDMPNFEKYDFYTKIQNIINSLEEEEPDKIFSSQSDEVGFFTVGPVELIHSEENEILVLVKIPSDNVVQDIPDDWEFKLKKVWSQFHGGLVAQTHFEYETGGGSYEQRLPEYFPTRATATAQCAGIQSINGYDLYTKVGWVKNAYSYKFVNPLAEYDYYGYAIVDKTMEDQVTDTWVQIGNSGSVWVEIDDDILDEHKLNYILPWEIIKAKMVRLHKDDEAVPEKEVEMVVTYPNDDVPQDTIPPNACVLFPKDGRVRGFHNPDWALTITYKYRYMTNTEPDSGDETIKVVFPNLQESYGDGIYFVSDPPADLFWGGGDQYSMSTGIRRGTMAAVTGFTDEDGRLYAAIATKLVAYVTTQYCRNVEIYYKYAANASGYDLIPNSGFFTYTAGNKALSGTFIHGMVAPCGTHECNPSNCIGPMWYPFNSCADHMFYNVHTGPNQCTTTFVGQGKEGITNTVGGRTYRSDYRYVNPELYKAWARVGGNWAAACGNGWYYSYSKASNSVQFKGYCNIRGKIDERAFALNGWQLPKFGNKGREMLERWMSKEYTSYIDLSQQPPKTESMWMPHIFDDTDLFFSFNCFEEMSGGYPTAPDYFSFISQLSLMIYDDMAESVQESRYKFDEIIELTHHGACMYPSPFALRPSGAPGVTRYRFKDNSLVWAWKEYWLPIVRTAGGEPKLKFLEFIYPEYYHNPYKDEIQYVCDESLYEIIFTAPIVEEGKMVNYPSVSLGGGKPRYFEIMYDKYDHELVIWKDEDEEGAVEGSSGGNYYEETSGTDWNHDENILFSPGAVDSTDAAEDAGRKVQVGFDEYGSGAIYRYFNRGLITHIYRDMLVYFPMDEFLDASQPITSGAMENNIHDIPGELLVTQLNENTTNPNISYSFSAPICIKRILINGYWGTLEKSDEDGKKIDVVICRPGVVVTSVVGEQIIELHESKYLDGGFLAIFGGSEPIAKYAMTIELEPTPKRMIDELNSNVLLELKLINQQWVSIDSIEIYYTQYKIEGKETIETFEQKYVVSTSEQFGMANPDGVESESYRSYDRDYKNAGQYFPISVHEEAFVAKDKMMSVATNDLGAEKERVDITYGTLHTKEEQVQKEIYEKMYGLDELDVLNYRLKPPPILKDFLVTIGIQDDVINGASVFKSEKIAWANNSVALSYKSSPYWRPGGHWYRWGPDAYKTRCYLFGDVEEVYSPVFVHHDHGGTENPVDPGHAYAGWVRIDYYDGRLAQFEDEPHVGDRPIDPLTGAKQTIHGIGGARGSVEAQ